MKVTNFDNQEDWLEARKTKITGSRLKDLIVTRGLQEKIGFYELIAERLALPSTEQDPMERGQELEAEAIAEFEKLKEKKVDTSLVIWERDDNPSIAISPDGFIGKTEAVEVKCLSSSRHIEAVLKNEIPNEYNYQVLQYFIVNNNLKKLYFVLYDPRLSVKKLHIIEVDRDEIEEEIKIYLEYQKDKLKKINEIVNKLTF